MRSVYTLVFVGCISFTSFTAHAQVGGTGAPMDSLIQAITSGGSAGGISVENVISDVTSQIMDAAAPTEQQSTIIQGPLTVDNAVVPEVNRTVVEVIDSRTGRYPPKLKINFAEFPLRSFAEAKRSNNGRSVQAGTPTEIVVQRIQGRLRVPEFVLAVENRTATVSGTVATERERKLIESMLRFEPGISVVKNEITVVP